MNATYSIPCPIFCNGGVGTLTIRGYGRPVTVQPCTICGCKPWTVRFTEAEHYLPQQESTVLRHRDGLVTFGGAL